MRSLLLLAMLTTSARAQRHLSAEVRKFVTVDASVVVLKHVRVIDGTGEPPLTDQTLVIDNGRIVAIARNAKIPAQAKVLDLNGRTVIPGLVGMHDHLFYPTVGSELSVELAESFPRLYLAAGVTTIRTAGAVEPVTDIAIGRAINAGKAVGPRVYATGPYLEGVGTSNPQMRELTNAAEATRDVTYWADNGASSFKAYQHITAGELSAAVAAAHQRGLKITGHLCSLSWREAIALGIDNLEHGPFASLDSGFLGNHKEGDCPQAFEVMPAALQRTMDSVDVRDLIRRLVAANVAVTSTLAVYEAQVPNRPVDERALPLLALEYQTDFLSLRLAFSDPSPTGPVLSYYKMATSPWPKLFALEMAFERAFVVAGGLLVAGGDPTGQGGVLAGYADQREVELLVEAGFSAVEAIHIATANGARLLNDGDIGQLAPGKRADLVVLSANPADDIRNIEKVEMVFKDGIGFDPKRLTDSVRGAVGLR